jgi:hypothetical protein
MYRHFGSNLETAAADARADRNLKILDSAPEFYLHLFNRFRSDPGHYPPPSGVNGSHSPCSGVHNDNGQTVGRSNCDTQSRFLTEKRIACANLPRLCGN